MEKYINRSLEELLLNSKISKSDRKLINTWYNQLRESHEETCKNSGFDNLSYPEESIWHRIFDSTNPNATNFENTSFGKRYNEVGKSYWLLRKKYKI